MEAQKGRRDHPARNEEMGEVPVSISRTEIDGLGASGKGGGIFVAPVR